MENLFIEAVKIINPLQLILIGLMFFYFYNRLDNKMEKLEVKLEKFQEETKGEIKSINARIDKLYDLILDLYKTMTERKAA